MGVCCSSRKDATSGSSNRKNLVAVSKKSRMALEALDAKNDELERFVQATIAAGKPWTDPDFPPNSSSLVDPAVDGGDPGRFASYSWKRVPEIYEKPQIFEDGVEPNDINQGSLGDCYFLAALSSLAEFEDRVKAMFVTKEINEAGIYLVRFFLNGIETNVVIDDHLPTRANGSPAFATSRDGELWVSFLEKAWAKLHGTYARTEGGLPSFAASHITGVPSESHFHDSQENVDEFWAMLQRADRCGFTMMAASHGQGEERSADGVISGHAYSLISIYEFLHRGQEVRLLKLRNPWGRGEWAGAWSDSDEVWTPQLREELGCVEADDGVFFIAL